MTVIGVGIDLVDLERVRQLLTQRGEQAMLRFFSERERAYLATRADATGQTIEAEAVRHAGEASGLKTGQQVGLMPRQIKVFVAPARR